MEIKSNVEAYAKVNLSLAVNGFTEDGYHDLTTVMTAVSIYDTVKIGVSESGENKVEYAGRTGYAFDNALSTLNAITKNYGLPFLKCEITKRIPEGAGLGGSSADSAGIIRAVQSAFGIKISEEFMLSCGSDVPFLVSGGTKLIRGRGRIEAEIKVPTLYFTLVYGDARVDTAKAFALYDKEGGASGNALDFMSAPFNALERSARIIAPEIGNYRKILADSGYKNVVMTGSGSAFIGFTDDRDKYIEWHNKAYKTATLGGYKALGLTNVKDYL